MKKRENHVIATSNEARASMSAKILCNNKQTYFKMEEIKLANTESWPRTQKKTNNPKIRSSMASMCVCVCVCMIGYERNESKLICLFNDDGFEIGFIGPYFCRMLPAAIETGKITIFHIRSQFGTEMFKKIQSRLSTITSGNIMEDTQAKIALDFDATIVWSFWNDKKNSRVKFIRKLIRSTSLIKLKE